MIVLKRPSYPVKSVMSAWTKLAVGKLRSCAARFAAATAVGVRSIPTTVALGGQGQRKLGIPAARVEHVTANFARPEQRSEFRLWLTDVPRRRPLEDPLLSINAVPVHTSSV